MATHIEDGLIQRSKLNEIYNLIDLKHHIEEYSNGAVMVTPRGVTFNGKPIDGRLNDRLLGALDAEDGAEYDTLESLTNFMIKLDENPSYKAAKRLYDFIQANDIKIDKNGDIIAYKVANKDYLDKFTHTIDNTPGNVVKMSRNDVNDDDTATCSHGLHVMSPTKYLSFYHSGFDRVVEVKINPKDFCAIPVDYNDGKARVCEYLVVRDVTDEFLHKD